MARSMADNRTYASRRRAQAALADKWEREIAAKLLGKRITKVEYISTSEADDCDWHVRPLAIQLDGEIWLTPVSDDEGNNGGAFHTNIVELPIIPVIGNR